MKKLCLTVLAILLLALCACSKHPVQELPAPVKTAENPMPGEPAAEQQISGESDTQPADAPTEKPAAPESFVATETVPSLVELQGSEDPAESLLLLKSQQYGPITACYYAAAPNLDVWDIRQALFGTTGMEMPAQIERPADLGFVPFRTYSNPSATDLLICKNDGDVYTYYLYDGVNLHELTTLNDRPFGVVYPPHVRWRSDGELVYDIENPETGKFTTYVYNILTQTEQVLLADYDPYPFYAADTASERYLLVHDTYALRVERGGTVAIRNLSDGAEQMIAGFTLPEGYSHLYVGSGDMVFYRAGYQDGAWRQIGFIDCATGSCAVLNRTLPGTLREAFDLVTLSETAFALQASAETELGMQNYLLIYDVSSWRNPPFAGGITLYAGSDTALVNSEPVQMPAAPFVENDIFYLPLQFVAETMGWEYHYEAGTVRLQSSLHWTTLTVGKRSICIDGIEAAVTGCAPDAPRSACVPDSYVPVERDGVVFVPLNYLSARTDNDTVSQIDFYAQWFPEDGYVIIKGDGKEDGIGGFYVWDIYDNLPAEQRAPMEELGVVGFSRDAYDVVEYGADELFVHVLRLRDGCEDWDRLDGVVSAVYTTNPDIPTPRGLRVGDSISRIYTTYDPNFYMQLLCITEGDVITQIRFTSYYDVDERIREQPQNLHMDAATAAGQDDLPS